MQLIRYIGGSNSLRDHGPIEQDSTFGLSALRAGKINIALVYQLRCLRQKWLKTNTK